MIHGQVGRCLRTTGRPWCIELQHFQQAIGAAGRQPPVVGVPRERVELHAVGNGDLLGEVDEHLSLLCPLRQPRFGLGCARVQTARAHSLSDGQSGSLERRLGGQPRSDPWLGLLSKVLPGASGAALPHGRAAGSAILDWEANPSECGAGRRALLCFERAREHSLDALRRVGGLSKKLASKQKHSIKDELFGILDSRTILIDRNQRAFIHTD